MRKATLLVAIWLTSCATARIAPQVPPSLEECAPNRLERVRDLDVAIAIDASRSAARPSGADLDADGTTGAFRTGASTDPDDSLLAAQVAAVHALLAILPERDLRLSIVTFSGQWEFPHTSSHQRATTREAVVHSELTSDPLELEAALDRIRRKGTRSGTDFSAAIRQSMRTLSDPNRKRMVLMMSDSPVPILPAPTATYHRTVGPYSRRDPDLKAAARLAIRTHVVINTFGLGGAAETDTPHILSRLAGATGGRYRAVHEPSRLHCELMDALSPQQPHRDQAMRSGSGPAGGQGSRARAWSSRPG